jgi:hypothetical protein
VRVKKREVKKYFYFAILDKVELVKFIIKMVKVSHCCGVKLKRGGLIISV